MAIKEDNDRIRQQFISIDELFYGLGKQENITEEEVATWVFNKKILDDLPLFERNPTTLATKLVERQKTITRDDAEKIISKLHIQSQQQLEQSLSIDDFDNFTKRNAEITIKFIEKTFPIVSAAEFLPLENQDEWDRKFMRYAELYVPLKNETFNTGWSRTDLYCFLEKHGVTLSPVIDYPTWGQRQEHFKSKFLNSDPQASLDCYDEVLKNQNLRTKKDILRKEILNAIQILVFEPLSLTNNQVSKLRKHCRENRPDLFTEPNPKTGYKGSFEDIYQDMKKDGVLINIDAAKLKKQG